MKKNLFIISALLFSMFSASAVKHSVQDLKQTESTFEFSQKSPDAAFNYYFYEALRYKQLQKYDSVLYCLAKCEDIYPMNPQVHFEKARVNVTYNRLPDAMKEIETAISLDSTESSYIDMAMNLSYEIKDLPKAIHYAEKIHALRPDKNYYLMTLASLYAENRQAKEAIATLDELEKQVGMSLDITKYKFANWISGFHDKKKAMAEYDKLIAAYPAEPQYITAKADAYSYLGDFRNTEKTLKKGLKKMPDSGVLRYEMCMYYIAKKRDLKKVDKYYLDPVLESRDIEYEQKMADGTRYIPIVGQAASKSIVRLFARIDDRAEAYVDPDTWETIYSYKHLHENDRDREYYVWFWNEDDVASAERHQNERTAKRDYTIPPGTMDSVAWVFEIRTKELVEGKQYVWYTFDGWTINRVTVKVQGMEDVWTENGFYHCRKFEIWRERSEAIAPRGALSGVFIEPARNVQVQNYKLATAWLADDKLHTPVRMVVDTGIGEFDLLLKAIGKVEHE